ncbi:MAG: dienelactone hydrolase family protein [Planctomycetes bacterium]|nr:dienelactone hydrolase family protein [Planctomycetota bacterium]
MNTSPFQSKNPIRLLAMAALLAGLVALPVQAGDDPDPQKLAQEMEAAYRAGQYDKALTLGEKLHKLDDDNPTHMYNLACLNCLVGKKDKAYEWLDKAVDAGWKEADQLANDADFKTIRGEDRFRAIVSKVRNANSSKADKKIEKKKPKKDDDDEDDDGDDDDDDDDADKKPAKVEKKSPKKEAKDDDEDDEDDDKGDQAEKSEQVQELTQQLIAAAEAKEYDKALKLALKAQKIADVGLTNYNVACMYSLKGDKDKAFEYLERAIKKGDFPRSITDQMEGDSDLDNIRKDARYEKMVALAKSGKAKGGDRRTGGNMQKAEFKWKVTLPKKHDADEKTPLIVVLHGAGGNMNEAAATWKKAADKAGAILLTPQGTMKQGDGFNWGQDMDTVEENVLMAIDKVANEHKIDKSKIVLAGFSQGAMMTWSLALRNPDTFCGIIPVSGPCNAKSDSAFDDADLAKLKIYTILGGEDKAEMLKSAKDAAKKLEKKGAKVKVAEFEDLGHAYPENTDAELGKALKFVMAD